MNKTQKLFLLIDGIVNLLPGVLLLLYPIGIIDLLGLPPTDTLFYPSIFGAVLFGIGLAFLLELIGFEKYVRGLGLGGAIVINMVGSIALFCWLIFGSLVFAIGIAELVAKPWKYKN